MKLKQTLAGILLDSALLTFTPNFAAAQQSSQFPQQPKVSGGKELVDAIMKYKGEDTTIFRNSMHKYNIFYDKGSKRV